MTDERRRVSDLPLEIRVTVIETQLLALGGRFDAYASKSEQLIEKLDSRADRQDIMMARLLAGISVIMVLAQLLAPVLRRFFGLPT